MQRRTFLIRSGLAISGLGLTGALVAGQPGRPLASRLAGTPDQTPGPFYRRLKPLSVDADLTRRPERAGVAQGRPLDLSGRVLDRSGRPVTGARVEIWQANSFGRYRHPRDAGLDLPDDPAFDGIGHDMTDDDGAYQFRTIVPGRYPGRTRHIHAAIYGPGDPKPLITQFYFPEEPGNDGDFLYRSLGDAAGRVTLDLQGADAGDLDGRLDIVLG